MTKQITSLTEVTTTEDGDLLLIRDATDGVDKKMQAQNLRAKATTKDDVGLGSVPNLDTTDAVNKAHDQNTDTALDQGGANEVTATDARAHIDSTANPHGVTKTQVGLGNVDNVSAADLRDRSTHTGTQPLSTISDAGTIASQDANSVNIDGGTIDGTAIGSASESSGAFTTLSSTSTTTLNGTTIPASKTLVDTNSTQTIEGKAVIGATSASVGFSSFSRFAVGGASPVMYFDVDYYANRAHDAGTISDSILLYNSRYPGGTSLITNSPAIRFQSFTGATFRTARLYERNGELYARDNSGNETVISPHNFNLIPNGPSEDIAFAYYSTNPDGRTINVDMLRLARLVEDLTGETLVYTDTVDVQIIEETKANAE